MTATVVRPPEPRDAVLERLAWRHVLAVAAAPVALLMATAARHGFHRDELYFLAAGRHPDWGYVDQPPLTPLLARAQTAVFGQSVVAIRVLPALATALTLVLAALLARELGGGRPAQVLAAGALASAGFVLGVGHLLATATFDFAFWLALIWMTARLLRTGEPRWWLAVGTLGGLALWNKDLIVLLGVSLLAGLALGRRRDLLVSPWLIAGVVLAGLIALPTLVWQAANGWPQVTMARALSARIGTQSRVTLLPGQLVLLGPLLVPLGVAGARWLLRPGAGRLFRPLLWAYVAALLLTFVTAGRPYYPLGLAVALVVAGSVSVAERRGLQWRRAVALVVANAALDIPLALPVLPLAAAGTIPRSVNETIAETIGWPEMVDQVAAVVRGLPPVERRGVVLLAGSYGEAGALERYGPGRGLPIPYSGHNSYWGWRRPADDRATVVAVNMTRRQLDPYFEQCTAVASVDNHYHIDNGVRGRPVTVCRGLRGTWVSLWPSFRHYD